MSVDGFTKSFDFGNVPVLRQHGHMNSRKKFGRSEVHPQVVDIPEEILGGIKSDMLIFQIPVPDFLPELLFFRTECPGRVDFVQQMYYIGIHAEIRSDETLQLPACGGGQFCIAQKRGGLAGHACGVEVRGNAEVMKLRILEGVGIAGGLVETHDRTAFFRGPHQYAGQGVET